MPTHPGLLPLGPGCQGNVTLSEPEQPNSRTRCPPHSDSPARLTRNDLTFGADSFMFRVVHIRTSKGEIE